MESKIFRLFQLMTQMLLDGTDRRFLALLQADNRRALRDYADELGISAPTCLRRLRRLKAQGVIVRHAAIVDVARVGFVVTAFVEVSLVNATGSHMAAFERRMQRCSDVMQCSELSGDVDYLLTVLARDMQTFSNFTRKHLADDRSIRTYRTLLVLKNVKRQLDLPWTT
jgi:Lrp/AsnC family transcriptional regulator, leucine-responsive regulatory protein